MTDKKSLTDLVDELVNVRYELEKMKYSQPDRRHGWITAAYVLSYGLDSGLGKRQIADVLQKRINETMQEMSDLSAKVEVTN